MHGTARSRAIAAAAMLALFPIAARAQSAARTPTCPDAARLTRGIAEPLATVRYLADDALEGRLAGSAGERCAGNYIASRFAALGLRGAGSNGGFFQDVTVPSTGAAADPHGGAAATATGRNVIALLEGTDASLRGEVIVVGAHYDHLGMGGRGSLEPGTAAIHNGADDNASGVSALLRAAELLAAAPRPARSVLFIAFTGEEAGLLGSAHFARSPTVDLDRARAMLNMDMVGRLEGDPLIVYGTGTASEWTGIVESEAAAAGIVVALQPDGVGPSDHTSFYLRDIPVLHFFTNTHADYHKPSDDWERIDAAGIDRIAQLVTSIVRRIAAPDVALTLEKGAGRPPAAPTTGSGAWLGTVPDFTPVERGVLLGGVTAGSPGEQAGMLKGDVLIRLGTHDIADLQAFTDALAAYKPGDAVEIVVVRDGREVQLRAVLGRRGG